MRLGIIHQRIRPGCPQENGAHERMHRTLKREALKPVRGSCAAQQRNFDAFRREYNTERPHEHLGQETPTSQYVASPHPYAERLATPEYPRHFIVKSSTLTSTLLEHGLADAVLLIVCPVLLGTGRRFFAEGTPPRLFELVSTKAMPSGVILSIYEVAGPLKTGEFDDAASSLNTGTPQSAVYPSKK